MNNAADLFEKNSLADQFYLDWILSHFKVSENLEDFRVRTKGWKIEIEHYDNIRGYVFVGFMENLVLRGSIDFGGLIDKEMKSYETRVDRKIKDFFISYEENLAGFSWKAKVVE